MFTKTLAATLAQAKTCGMQTCTGMVHNRPGLPLPAIKNHACQGGETTWSDRQIASIPVPVGSRIMPVLKTVSKIVQARSDDPTYV
jgi:hypothetical protein